MAAGAERALTNHESLAVFFLFLISSDVSNI